MKWNYALVAVLPVILVGAEACGGEHMPPKSLVDARADYSQARNGLAMQLDPTDVHEADVSLQTAEQAFRDAPDDQSTADLAMIADRKALLAESQAAGMKATQDAQLASQQVQATRATQLNQTQQALGATQMQLQQQQAQTAADQQKLQALEANLKDARATIAKIASVKDDDRGLVITLSGEVLFKTAKWDLKPGAMAKLDQIADALKSNKEAPITVYGYTDNVGTRDNNQELSQRRADSVRTYLVSKGIPQDLITAQGKGPDAPVADNESLEGRAQNRRVELVVSPKK
jgi:outer membrane protein OmpA-like peptidoglycan-associated protein